MRGHVASDVQAYGVAQVIVDLDVLAKRRGGHGEAKQVSAWPPLWRNAVYFLVDSWVAWCLAASSACWVACVV